ncbi:LPS export ABC transporter periplasmic protein LptC [Labilibacter sediminis]|nr:LPS export ABC transporter periplasmic protein LptC [Labilibacter sediminis]
MISDYYKNIRIHLNKTASAMLLAVLFFNLACTSNKPEEIRAIGDNQDIPSLEIIDFETVITDSGKVKYHIITPHLLDYDKKEEPYTEYPQGGHIMTYDTAMVIATQIKCKYAIYHKEEDLWDLRNDVEAVNEDGVVFNSEQLFWDQKKEIIYTEKFVKITTEKDINTGYGLVANQNMKKYRLKNYSGTIAIDEEETE